MFKPQVHRKGFLNWQDLKKYLNKFVKNVWAYKNGFIEMKLRLREYMWYYTTFYYVIIIR